MLPKTVIHLGRATVYLIEQIFNVDLSLAVLDKRFDFHLQVNQAAGAPGADLVDQRWSRITCRLHRTCGDLQWNLVSIAYV